MAKPPQLSEPLIEALKALIEWLNHQQVPYAVVGGVAVSLSAQPRVTQDVDSIVGLIMNNGQGSLNLAPSSDFSQESIKHWNLRLNIASFCLNMNRTESMLICHLAQFPLNLS
jgi:hypothetical protein